MEDSSYYLLNHPFPGWILQQSSVVDMIQSISLVYTYMFFLLSTYFCTNENTYICSGPVLKLARCIKCLLLFAEANHWFPFPVKLCFLEIISRPLDNDFLLFDQLWSNNGCSLGHHLTSESQPEYCFLETISKPLDTSLTVWPTLTEGCVSQGTSFDQPDQTRMQSQPWVQKRPPLQLLGCNSPLLVEIPLSQSTTVASPSHQCWIKDLTYFVHWFL